MVDNLHIFLNKYFWYFIIFFYFRVTGGELFEDIVAREYYSEADARYYMNYLIKCLHALSFMSSDLPKPFCFQGEGVSSTDYSVYQPHQILYIDELTNNFQSLIFRQVAFFVTCWEINFFYITFFIIFILKSCMIRAI